MSGDSFSARLADVARIVERSRFHSEDTHELLRDLRRAAPTSRHRAEAACLEARWLDRVGRDAEALIALDTAHGLIDSDDQLLADVFATRGRILARRGQLLAANEAAHTALKHNPAHVEARLVLARVYRELQEPRRAITLYHEVLPLIGDPIERAEVQLTIAGLYRRQRLPVLARAHARAILQRNGTEQTSLPIAVRARAVWLRLSSLPRLIRWLTMLASGLLILAAVLGSLSWSIAVTGAVAVVTGVGLVAWFTAPAVDRTRTSSTRRRAMPRRTRGEQK